MQYSIFSFSSPQANYTIKDKMGMLAEGSPGATLAGDVMPGPVAPGDVAGALGPREGFATADAPVAESCDLESRIAERGRGVPGSGRLRATWFETFK